MPAFDTMAVPGGFAVCRAAKIMRTPAGHDMRVPTQKLAEALAEEFANAGDKPKPKAMPLAQLAATALDIVAVNRDDAVRSVVCYASSDLLCHRADEPPALAERQAKIWQPWLDWARHRYGAAMRVGTGVMPIKQADESLEAFGDAVTCYDSFGLVGLQQAASLTGSLVLGLALAERAADSQQLFEASELDSIFQMEKWGEDPVTLERHANARRELEIAEKWFGLLRK